MRTGATTAGGPAGRAVGTVSAMLGRTRWIVAVLAVVATAAAAACSGGDDDDSDGGEGGERDATTTTVAMTYAAEATGEAEINGGWRQGLARADGGWVFSTNNGLFRTGEDFVQAGGGDQVIPPELAAEGLDHVGDIDIADGVLWAPLEGPERTEGQVIARYDAGTLAYVGSEPVEQDHAAWVAVDGDVVYSMNEFESDDTVLRYRWTGGRLEPGEPLVMGAAVERVQGGDVADGALWLSTDDDTHGIYRVDLASGEVTAVGSAGRVDGEGEGIDATDLPAGLLHVLVADAEIIPMWLTSFAVTATPA